MKAIQRITLSPPSVNLKYLFADYAKKFPDEAAEIALIRDRGLPDGWDSDIPDFAAYLSRLCPNLKLRVSRSHVEMAEK